MKIIALTTLTLSPAHPLVSHSGHGLHTDIFIGQKGGHIRTCKVFSDTAEDARPQVWWHWMDGNVSKEGIRKDIEWMKRNGIGGFHQFDAGGVNMPRAAKVKLPTTTTVGKTLSGSR